MYRRRGRTGLRIGRVGVGLVGAAAYWSLLTVPAIGPPPRGASWALIIDFSGGTIRANCAGEWWSSDWQAAERFFDRYPGDDRDKCVVRRLIRLRAAGTLRTSYADAPSRYACETAPALDPILLSCGMEVGAKEGPTI